MGAKIPQNVTREDKLVGPLTLKQFLYVLGGVSIVFIAYQYYALMYLYFIEFAVISFFVAALTLALAFANINGRPFSLFAMHLFQFLTAQRNRMWQKEPRHILSTIKVKADDIKDTKSEIKERKHSGKDFKTQLEKLSSILDSGGTINAEHQDAVTNQISNLPEVKNKLDESQLGVEDVLSEVD